MFTCSNLSRPVLFALLTTLVALAPRPALSQEAWRPDKPVEIVLPTGAGGLNDQNARLIQKVLQEHKLVAARCW